MGMGKDGMGEHGMFASPMVVVKNRDRGLYASKEGYSAITLPPVT